MVDGSEYRFISGSKKIRSTRIGIDSVLDSRSVCSLIVAIVLLCWCMPSALGSVSLQLWLSNDYSYFVRCRLSEWHSCGLVSVSLAKSQPWKAIISHWLTTLRGSLTLWMARPTLFIRKHIFIIVLVSLRHFFAKYMPFLVTFLWLIF